MLIIFTFFSHFSNTVLCVTFYLYCYGILFQSLNPGWALFLLYGMKDFPRSTLLYLYFMEYETMFLPFAHVVCPILEDVPKYDFTHSVSFLANIDFMKNKITDFPVFMKNLFYMDYFFPDKMF